MIGSGASRYGNNNNSFPAAWMTSFVKRVKRLEKKTHKRNGGLALEACASTGGIDFLLGLRIFPGKGQFKLEFVPRLLQIFARENLVEYQDSRNLATHPVLCVFPQR